MIVLIDGAVTIRCQKLFAPTKVRGVFHPNKPPPSVSVVAGGAERVDGSAGPNYHHTTFNFSPAKDDDDDAAVYDSAGRGLNGGIVIFVSTNLAGGLLGGVANGGNGKNGGDGGSGGQMVISTVSGAAVSLPSIAAAGGSGGPGDAPSGRNGGKGGCGGTLSLTGTSSGNLIASGGQGGDGAHGSTEHPDGTDGGDAGNGGARSLRSHVGAQTN